MTKRGRILMLVAVIFILGIAGCNKRESAEREDVNGQEYFNAKVTEVYDNILEVKCLDVTSGAVGEGAMVHVQRNVASANAVPDVKVGDEIRVVFSGGVMESYPLQLGTVWAIYALDEDGNVIAGESNDSREFELNWEWLYGKLPAGTYRIGKEIMDFRETGDYDTEWYYTEFEIK